MAEDMLPTPEECPVVVLPETVVFPHILSSLAFHDAKSLAAIDEAMNREPKMLVCVAQRPESQDAPEEEGKTFPDRLYRTGTMVLIHKLLRIPAGGVAIMVQGYRRIRILDLLQEEPFYRARIEPFPEPSSKDGEVEALMRTILGQVKKLAAMAPYLPDEFETMVLNIDNPHHLAYLVVTFLKMPVDERQRFLEIDSPEEKLMALASSLERELGYLELGGKIKSKIQDEVQKSQRDFFLREQVKAIQKELGDGAEGEEEIVRYRERINESGLPDDVRKEVEREVDRLVRLGSGQSQEAGVIRTYLDTVLDLPWNRMSPLSFDLEKAREILDEDHYGLEKIKERILDELAVLSRVRDGVYQGPVLCLIGPPGVGKTTLGQSIARAMGREFVRVSLGGVRDEAEIRGHRRTYVGAMPGRIIQGMRKAGTRNPVFMLDEIDKVGGDYRGDPASALLEVLDRAQNKDFRDHYLDLPFDLSKVFFITTANVFQTIPPPLLDRMDLIRLAGYTWEEKRHIARSYLIPRTMKEIRLEEGEFDLTDEALVRLIRSFTREAGVRSLERKISTILRKVLRARTEQKRKRRIVVTAESLEKYLGNEYVEPPKRLTEAAPGVVTGLAWTPNGGDVLFIESVSIPGQKGFILTGQLGDVMKESARASLSFVQSRSEKLGLSKEYFSKHEIHIHVPSGAIPKDGPSAGITMASAIASLVTGIPVPATIAMTGEIALSGRVLPVGGIKEKLIGAREAGIQEVFIPVDNEKDLEEIPEEVRKDLTIHVVHHMDELLDRLFLSHEKPRKGGGNGFRPNAKKAGHKTAGIRG
ncbi:endopeptidase La [Leptospirillum ferriphilum]|jgi:ATP-dependent Lon protease|uniref:Lon protease n=3 Tax=Leptospirillum ferriphilum TaxID=178606 RepID=A0A059Y0A7_9BACT|nr:endopeptidase La [Leptospirillum ferriphilum]AFS54081.1 ATP-dependent Lon protease, bacterial type [Leptospirillum ferriphilum ML-04]AIA30892.1 peptidase [Leptospirillum ferriphilum YSK]OOH73712.1 endopeptidase La [Leptospirillum ferriphilum]